jgi:hypothetical protein
MSNLAYRTPPWRSTALMSRANLHNTAHYAAVTDNLAPLSKRLFNRIRLRGQPLQSLTCSPKGQAGWVWWQLLHNAAAKFVHYSAATAGYLFRMESERADADLFLLF